MKINKKLFFLILSLSIISAVLIIWRFFFYRPVTSTTAPLIISPTPIPLITPFLSPTVTTTNKEVGDSASDLIQSLKKRFPLINFLPYENEDFRIDYQSEMTLKVVIKKGTRAEIEKEVKIWIESKGINPTTHQINYLTPELSPAL